MSEIKAARQNTILCCVCGIDILPNALNMCNKCLQNEVDITENICRQYVILECRGCHRFLKRTKWVQCQLESKELLTLCLKKINGLEKLKLIDARFLWTEPHSKRLQVKLVVQGESINNTIVQQSFVVLYTIGNQQCDLCQRSYTENTWQWCVQIRQRVNHKRTFFYLEQLILKQGLSKNMTGMKDVTDGLNFYYENKSHASQMVDFLLSVVPIQQNESKRLVSQDFHSNLTNYKHTIFAEIVPVCREDLVCLDSKNLRKKLGGDTPLLLCTKVTNQLTFVNPITLNTVSLNAFEYFKNKFKSLCTSRALVEFFVIDVVFLPLNPGQKKGKFQKASIECVRSEEVSEPEQYIEVTSHLGHLLRPGDLCKGYDLRTQNIGDAIQDICASKKLGRKALRQIPEVILVSKVYEKKIKETDTDGDRIQETGEEKMDCSNDGQAKGMQ